MLPDQFVRDGHCIFKFGIYREGHEVVIHAAYAITVVGGSLGES